MSFGAQGASSAWTTQSSDGTQSANHSLRPFANLNLTPDQRTQIRSILQNAKNQDLSPSEVQSQINAILTPSQQSTFDSNVAALKSSGHSGHHHKGGGEGNTSTGTSSNSTDAWGVTDDTSTDATVNGQSVADLQNQALAGVSIQLQQLENQLGSLTPGTSTTT